jgi:hypothetical protein
MAKKVKRQTNRATGSSVPMTVVTPSTSTPAVRLGGEREFNPDYAPVIKDLKRIGALAGSFFIILVALSFFLR